MSRDVSGPGTYVQERFTVNVSAPAYAAGDVVGGLITLHLNTPSGGGFLEDIILYDKGAVSADLECYVFDSKPTSIADSAAFALSDADLHKLIFSGTISGYVTPVSGNSYAKLSDSFARPTVHQLFISNTLWIYLVAVGTPDYAVGDLSMKVQVSQ